MGIGGARHSGGNGNGGGGSRRGIWKGRRRGGALGGNIQELKTRDITYCIKQIIGTESSIPMDFVLVLELHHPIMSTLWRHRDRPKRGKKE